ncbi:hypothetical protein D9M71_649100 [compost metagenome]
MGALEQAHPQPLRLEAPCAIQRLFRCDVALHALAAQFAHRDGKRHAIHLALPGGAVQQCQPSQKAHLLPATLQQLLASPFEGVRLTQHLFAQHSYLVRPDNQVPGMAARQGLGFLPGKAAYQFNGWLVLPALLVYIGACPGEGQVQASEQFAAIGRAGSQ